MIAGYALRRAHAQDLAAWQTMYAMQASGNYKPEDLPTVRTLLGRDPLPLDPRWHEPDESLTDEELERLAEDDSEARVQTFQAAGYPTGRVSPEEYEQMLRESKGL